MKPTIKVSISSVAFNLEEDAYRVLKQYLERLERHYAKIADGKEIVDDIELRVAELLGERISSPTQVVSEASIKEVIAILGRPEEIGVDDSLPEENASYTEKNTMRKKLYRDMDHKVLGGVCSGLASYCNIDVVLVRVLFVVFFIGFSMFHIALFRFTGGTSLLIYALMWIIIPPARTVQQRFEMHGETPTLKNIQRKVEEELREVGRSAQKAKPIFSEVGHVVGRICSIITGTLLVMLALFVLVALIVGLASGLAAGHIIFSDLMDYVAIDGHPWWFFGLLMGVIFLPFLGILYGGIKLLFRIKTKVKIGLIFFLLWLVSLFSLIGVGFFSSKSFFHWRVVHEYVELPTFQSDTLYIDIPQKYYDEGTLESAIGRIVGEEVHTETRNGRVIRRIENRRFFGYPFRTLEYEGDEYDDRRYSDEHTALLFYQKNNGQEEQLCLLPIIDIDYSSSAKNFSIDIRKGAAGNSPQRALEHAKQLMLNHRVSDSLLTVEPLLYSKADKWDGELIRLRIRVPEGKTLIFGKAFREHYELKEQE